jgi:hypothetical protein
MTSEANAAASRGYNGWPNYETWAVALWLSNEETSYRLWMAAARGAKLDAPRSSFVRELRMTEEEAAEHQLADEIKASVEANAPDFGVTVYADLLQAALSDVDWLSVAKDIMEGLD